MLDQSTIDTLLRNNDRPSETVLQDVRRSLHEAESEVEELEAQIRTMRQRVDVKASTIAQYKAILSPIRAVSDDVLREIFTQAVERDKDDSFHSPKQRDVPPVLLAHVCQRWRDVALSTPRLWCKILLTLPPLLVTGNSSNVRTLGINGIPRQCHLLVQEAERMDQWLKRAGALPLSISIHQGSLSPHGLWPQATDLNTQFSDKLSWMFQKISDYLPRCERLLFNLPDEHIYQLFSSHVTPEKIVRIKYFKPNIFRLHEAQRQQSALRTSLFRDLPTLRRLHLSHPMTFILFQERSSWPYPPSTWSSLTNMTVDGAITLSQAAVLMEQCPSLVELRLYISEQAWSPTALSVQQQKSRKHLLMAHLEYLKVNFNPSSFQPGGLWQSDPSTAEMYNVAAPRLQRLHYTVQTILLDRPDHDDHVAPDFTSGFPLDHILRSAENLTDLILSPRKIMEPGFKPAIQESGAHLTHLYIRSNSHFPPFIFQQYVDNGYELVSETDSAFQTLFPLPGWCKLPSFAQPVPLTEVEGVDMDELDRELDDLLCPRLEYIDLPGLQSIRPSSLLAFIVYRLRLYEYARHRGGWKKHPSFRPLTGLAAGILGKGDQDVDVSDTVQKLAAAVGVQFKLKVEYADQKAAVLGASVHRHHRD
ncbi:hypothetical protein BJ165DRAFT_1399758 [Panaeolus papilionaceus]|nr:hypothetical protein BJ165DRAFT_1399758 [Panaeolus papilionaceus]